MKKEVVKKTLSNGIVAYLYADKNLKRMLACYTVNYGLLGYYDQFYYDGKLYSMPPAVAHFIEHTLMETSKYGNLLHRFKEKSYEVNARTTYEQTSYYFVGIKDTWESLKELINAVDDVNYDEEAIEKVKNAVCEEANMGLDEKYRLAFAANKRNATKAYSATYENYNLLGTAETTKSITLEDVQACYDAYYSNDNKFLVIGGNFEIDEMVAYLEDIYKELPVHENKRKPVDYGDLLPIRKPYEELSKPVANEFCIVTYKMRDLEPNNSMEVDLYLNMFMSLKFAHDTDFVTQLIKDEVIIGGISTSLDFYKGILTVTFNADVLKREEFIKKLETQLNSHDLDEEMFELLKKSYKVNSLSKADYIYKSLLNFPRSIDFTDKLYNMEVIDSLTLEGLKKVVDSLDWNLKTVTVVKPSLKEKVN